MISFWLMLVGNMNHSGSVSRGVGLSLHVDHLPAHPPAHYINPPSFSLFVDLCICPLFFFVWVCSSQFIIPTLLFWTYLFFCLFICLFVPLVLFTSLLTHPPTTYITPTSFSICWPQQYSCFFVSLNVLICLFVCVSIAFYVDHIFAHPTAHWVTQTLFCVFWLVFVYLFFS